MLIEIDNVELSFSGQNLLKGIYLKLETGKITGVLGANGCGKSTLLNVVFGCQNPQHKLIRIDHEPFLKNLYLYKGLVKYLPQNPFIPKHLKLNTVFGLYGVNWKSFVKDFENMQAYNKYTMQELSGGERRIVEIYLILMSKAKILLLDEPFTHLSPIYVDKFCEILGREKNDKAIVITDHLYHHIIDVADDLYFLTNGCTQLVKDPIELENLKYLSSGTL